MACSSRRFIISDVEDKLVPWVVSGSRLLPTDRAGGLQSGSPPRRRGSPFPTSSTTQDYVAILH